MTGRPRYEITEEDFLHASHYLSSAFSSGDFKLENDETDWRKAEREFGNIGVFTQGVAVLPRLVAWCEKHLNEAQRKKLHAAVRKRRQRQSRDYDQHTITISRQAYQILKQLAGKERTYSAVIENHLGRVLRNRQRRR